MPVLTVRDECAAVANTVGAIEALSGAPPTLEPRTPDILDPSKELPMLPGVAADMAKRAAAELDFDEDTNTAVATLLKAADKVHARDKAKGEGGAAGATPPVTSMREALAIRTLVQNLGFSPFQDVVTARNYVTNRLLQLSSSQDEKIALRALELLGKHNDIGLFTERSEVTVHHTNAADLENSIRERIKRLAKAEIIDVTPKIADIDPSAALERRADKGVVDSFLRDLDAK